MSTWFIQPRNEGQDLNYIEGFEGDNAQAIQRARAMRIELSKAMPQGTITVEVLNKKGDLMFLDD